MIVKLLHIEKRPSYDSDFPNLLKGAVTLEGPEGSQTIMLSNKAIADIFCIITAEVHSTAQRNASAVQIGLTSAAHEGLALDAQTIKSVEFNDVPF